jgi:hypothetical protein
VAPLQLAKALDQGGEPEEALPVAIAEFIEDYRNLHPMTGTSRVVSGREVMKSNLAFYALRAQKVDFC